MALEDFPGILLVDDEEHVLEAYTMGLEMLGFNVMALSDGAAACEAVGRWRFQGVVCDVKLPGASGLDVYDACMQAQPQTNFVFFTGHAKGTPAMQGIEARGIHVLGKPVSFEELALVITKKAA